jgi:HPr kinase/phosphorylase
MELKIEDFYANYRTALGLSWVGREVEGGIDHPAVQRAGLSFAGAIKEKHPHRVLIFGRMELNFLKRLSSQKRIERLEQCVVKRTPCVIVSRGLTPFQELVRFCQEHAIPLFQTEMSSSLLQMRLSMLLTDFFGKTESVHGTFVEAYGIGVLIQGDSSIGKSEAALGLIQRGHRLIADDLVKLKVREGVGLVGCGYELNTHLLELRGIGMINIARLYGAGSIRKEMTVDMVIHLEEWNETCYYDRVGLKERFKEFLGVPIPCYLHPVTPKRDTVLLIETTLLNYRLKEMGHDAAKELNHKLLEEIARKTKIE